MPASLLHNPLPATNIGLSLLRFPLPPYFHRPAMPWGACVPILLSLRPNGIGGMALQGARIVRVDT